MSTLDIRRPSPHVAEVWLNRPDVRNAFNETMIAELTQAFTQLGADPTLRAIVLELPRIKEELAGKTVKKFIVVKKQNVNNIVNIVAG